MAKDHALPQLVTRPPPRAGDIAPLPGDAARARLKAAIDALNAAWLDLGDARGAENAALERKWTAYDALADIRHAAEAADPGAMADAFLCAFRAGSSIDAATLERSTSEARAIEAAAKRDIDVWTRTAAACEAAVAAKESAAAKAQKAVDAAVANVIRNNGAAARIMDGLEAMQAELVRRRVVLRFMIIHGLIDDAHAARAKAILSDTVLPGGVGSVEYRDWSRHSAHVAWQAALDALARDANAPLPRDAGG